MKKRILALLLAAAMCLGLAACGDSGQQGKGDSSSVPVSESQPEEISWVGEYTYLEHLSLGADSIDTTWKLVLNEDGTYQIDTEIMGNPLVLTGTYTVDDAALGLVTTGTPVEGAPAMIAVFNADGSLNWTLSADGTAEITSSGGGVAGGETAASNADYASVAYAGQSASQVCDIYLPEGNGPFPVIVVLHGGGFAFGSQTMEIIQPVIAAGVENGYAVVSVDYRKSSEAVFPAALADVKAAVRFIRANAGEYGFDADHIAVWGESAGAYLSLMTALTPEVEDLNGDVTENAGVSSAVTALVDFYGPVEFYTMDAEYAAMGRTTTTSEESSFESQFLGQAVGADEATTYKTYWETYKDQLPANFSLAAWVQVGNSDNSVPYTQSQNFAQRLAGVIGQENVSFNILEGAGHEDPAFYTEENLAQVFAFLDKVMK